MKKIIFTLCVMMCVASVARAQMRITEWMYSGSEFIEFTNIGSSNIDMNNWSFQDNDPTDNGGLGTDLSGFGTVLPGESVILAEDPAATFIAEWNLSGVNVIGDNINNLGRNDTINLYDASSTLIDTLSYGDQTYPGTIRTQNYSGNPSSPSVLGQDDVSGWVLASVGDQFGSYTSTGGFVGNPGQYTVPEPSTVPVLLGCLFMAGIFVRFRRNKSAV
jgi:predicted extracellular nuclease